MLRSTIEAAQQREDNDVLIKLINLQARLYTKTELGRELEQRHANSIKTCAKTMV